MIDVGKDYDATMSVRENPSAFVPTDVKRVRIFDRFTPAPTAAELGLSGTDATLASLAVLPSGFNETTSWRVRAREEAPGVLSIQPGISSVPQDTQNNLHKFVGLVLDHAATLYNGGRRTGLPLVAVGSLYERTGSSVNTFITEIFLPFWIASETSYKFGGGEVGLIVDTPRPLRDTLPVNRSGTQADTQTYLDGLYVITSPGRDDDDITQFELPRSRKPFPEVSNTHSLTLSVVRRFIARAIPSVKDRGVITEDRERFEVVMDTRSVDITARTTVTVEGVTYRVLTARQTKDGRWNAVLEVIYVPD